MSEEDMLTSTILVFGLLIQSSVGTQQPDVARDISTFSGDEADSPSPDLDLLEDLVNNKIGNACLLGATRSDLQRLGIPDIDVRLEKLLSGHVLTLKDEKYFLGIRVIVGD